MHAIYLLALLEMYQQPSLLPTLFYLLEGRNDSEDILFWYNLPGHFNFRRNGYGWLILVRVNRKICHLGPLKSWTQKLRYCRNYCVMGNCVIFSDVNNFFYNFGCPKVLIVPCGLVRIVHSLMEFKLSPLNNFLKRKLFVAGDNQIYALGLCHAILCNFKASNLV